MDQGVPHDPAVADKMAWRLQEHRRKRLGAIDIKQHPSQQLAGRTSNRSLQRTRWPRALCTGPSKRH